MADLKEHGILALSPIVCILLNVFARRMFRIGSVKPDSRNDAEKS